MDIHNCLLIFIETKGTARWRSR